MSHIKIKALTRSVVIFTALSFSLPAFANFEGFGTDIPLDRAAREIAPSNISIDYGEGVDKSVSVSWSSAADWQSALRSAVSKRGYTANFGTNSVVIAKAPVATSASSDGASKKSYSSSAKSSAASNPRPRAAPAPKRTPAPAREVAEAAPQGGGGFTIRPYKGGKPAEEKTSTVVSKAPEDDRMAKKSENFESYKPASSQFSVSTGQMLHPVIAEWASKSGWTVIWETEYDYRIEANANFSGDFVSAVTQIVTAMAAARPAITVDFYQGNNVAVVSNKSADSVN